MNMTRRSGSGYGSGRSRTAFTTEKIAVLAPIPSASAADRGQGEHRALPEHPQRVLEILDESFHGERPTLRHQPRDFGWPEFVRRRRRTAGSRCDRYRTEFTEGSAAASGVLSPARTRTPARAGAVRCRPMPVKLTPNGAGFALKPSGNGGVGAFGTSAERHDHRRIAGPRARAPAPVPPGNSSASSRCAFIDLVDPVRRPTSCRSFARSAS